MGKGELLALLAGLGVLPALATDLVLTAASGVVTNSAALVADGATRIVKQGAGEVVLAADTTDVFPDGVVVEAGTLSVLTKSAIGATTPVTVNDGATFIVRVPSTGVTQKDPLFVDHVLTISGAGVDGTGAFKFQPSATDKSSIADTLLTNLTLAADATIDVSTRWGLHGGGTGMKGAWLNLNGHTLTKRGSSNFLLIDSSIDAGTFWNVAGTTTLQGVPKVDAGTTFNVTNSTFTLWGTSRNIPAAVNLYSNGYIQAGSGSAATLNVISGPVTAYGYSHLQTRTATCTLNLTGRLTINKGAKLNLNLNASAGLVDIRGDVIDNGDNNSCLYSTQGDLYCTNAATYALGRLSMNSKSRTWLDNGMTTMRMLRLGNGGGGKWATLRQTGGRTTIFSTDSPFVGESAGSHGCYLLEGGSLTVSNAIYFGHAAANSSNPAAQGWFIQTNGTYRQYGALNVGRAGSGIYHLSGGTSVVQPGDVLNQAERFFMSVNGGTSEVTFEGSNTLFATDKAITGNSVSNSVTVLTIKDGAVFKATRFQKRENENTRSYVNLDGGIVYPTYAYGWPSVDQSNTNFYKRAPTRVTLFEKGVTFDLSECAASLSDPTKGVASSVLNWSFHDPIGKGIATIALPTDAKFAVTNYIMPARVVFTSTTGYGASAYAVYDFKLKKLTGIRVTSSGCGYDENTTVALESADCKTTYPCTFTLTDPLVAGPLVKRGAARLNLYATNDYTGGTIVQGGSLYAAYPGVLPAGTDYTIGTNATLDLNNNALVMRNLAGAGTLYQAQATVTNELRVTTADLFAGRYLTTSSSTLTFTDTTRFVVTDPENLWTYRNAGLVWAAKGTLAGPTPTLSVGNVTGASAWRLVRSAEGLKFGMPQGTLFVVR